MQVSQSELCTSLLQQSKNCSFSCDIFYHICPNKASTQNGGVTWYPLPLRPSWPPRAQVNNIRAKPAVVAQSGQLAITLSTHVTKLHTYASKNKQSHTALPK